MFEIANIVILAEIFSTCIWINNKSKEIFVTPCPGTNLHCKQMYLFYRGIHNY